MIREAKVCSAEFYLCMCSTSIRVVTFQSLLISFGKARIQLCNDRILCGCECACECVCMRVRLSHINTDQLIATSY